jgi:hypothetical protein
MSSCSSRCFRIQSTERKGNIALAKRDYARGEVICENVAYCWVVRNHLWGYKCSYCFTSSGSSDHNNASGGDSTGGVKLLRCGKCKLLSYCSAECQKHDWVQHHKLECKHLSDWSQRASGELLDNIILLGRTIRKLKSSAAEISLTADCRHNTSASTPPGKSYPVVQCSSFHVNSLTNGGKFDDTSLMAIEKACKVLGYSVPEVAKLYLDFQCNNFGILDELLQCLGAGVFPLTAALNHSCQPNCFLQYNFSSKCGPSAKVGRRLALHSNHYLGMDDLCRFWPSLISALAKS